MKKVGLWKRLGSLLLAFVLVMSLLPAAHTHVHAEEEHVHNQNGVTTYEPGPIYHTPIYACAGCPEAYRVEGEQEKHTFINKVCTVCDYTCNHATFMNNGVCTNCGWQCPHENILEADGKCAYCKVQAVARVSGVPSTYYFDIRSALTKAQETDGCVLTLYQNVTDLTEALTISGGNFTIKGQSYGFSGTVAGPVLQITGGTVTLDNLKVTNLAAATGASAVQISGGTVELKGCTINSGYSGIYIPENSTTTVTLTGGTVTGSHSGVDNNSAGATVSLGTAAGGGPAVTGDVYAVSARGTVKFYSGSLTGQYGFYLAPGAAVDLRSASSTITATEAHFFINGAPTGELKFYYAPADGAYKIKASYAGTFAVPALSTVTLEPSGFVSTNTDLAIAKDGNNLVLKQCAHANVASPATCKNKAVCADCGQSFGDYAEHENTTATPNGDGTHDTACKDCGKLMVDNEACSGGNATCTTKATCEKCGAEYGNTSSGTHGAMDPATGLCMSGCGTNLAEASVAMSGTTTYYTTLQAALDAVKTATADDDAKVTLLKGITDSGDLKITAGVFTLDLNGHTVSFSTETSSTNCMQISGGTVELVSATSGGKLTHSQTYTVSVSGGSLTVGQNVTLEFTGSSAGFVGTVTIYDGTVTLDGGTLTATGNTSAVDVNGGSFTLTSGTVESASSSAVRMDDGKTNLNGGSITAGSYAISVWGGELNVGGTQIANPGINYLAFDKPGVLDFTNATGKKYTITVSAFGNYSLPVENLKYDAAKHVVTATDTNITDGSYARGTTVIVGCPHSSTTVTPNVDGTHDVTCEDCGRLITDDEACSGGTATCKDKATCEKCGGEYGDLKSHDMDYVHNGDDRTISYTCSECGETEVVFTLVIPTGQVYGDPNMQKPYISCSVEGYTGTRPTLDVYAHFGYAEYPEPGTYLAEMGINGSGIGGAYTIGKGNLTVTRTQGYANEYTENLFGIATVTGIGSADDSVDILLQLVDSNGKTVNELTCPVEDGKIVWNWLNRLADGSFVDAGDYTIVAKFAGNDKYNASETDLGGYTIRPLAITLTAADQTISYGDTIDTAVSKVASDHLVSTGQITAVTLTPSTDNVTANGTITPSAAVIKDGDTDVTANYDITYLPGKLTIQLDTSAIDDLTVDNVTSDDQDAIDTVTKQLENADDLTEEQQTVADEVEKLQQRLEDAAAAAEFKAEDITSDNLTVEDEEDLTDAKKALEAALEDYEGNYTDAELETIEEEIDRIEELLDVIAEAKPVVEAINKLPTTADPDDPEAIKEAATALFTVNFMSSEGRKLVTNLDKLENLLKSLLDYLIILGDGGKYTKGSSEPLSFTANGPVKTEQAEFVALFVDGKKVDAENYTVVSGSTVVTLKAEYLNTLKTGKHTIYFSYSFLGTGVNTNTASFRVVAKSTSGTNPDTGDGADLALWLGMMTVSTLAMATLLIANKKRSAR